MCNQPLNPAILLINFLNSFFTGAGYVIQLCGKTSTTWSSICRNITMAWTLWTTMKLTSERKGREGRKLQQESHRPTLWKRRRLQIKKPFHLKHQVTLAWNQTNWQCWHSGIESLTFTCGLKISTFWNTDLKVKHTAHSRKAQRITRKKLQDLTKFQFLFFAK